MLAQKDDVFNEACETIFKLNQDDVARYWAEAREEGLRRIRINEMFYEAEIAKQKKEIAKNKKKFAKSEKELAEKNAPIAMLME